MRQITEEILRLRGFRYGPYGKSVNGTLFKANGIKNFIEFPLAFDRNEKELKLYKAQTKIVYSIKNLCETETIGKVIKVGEEFFFYDDRRKQRLIPLEDLRIEAQRGPREEAFEKRNEIAKELAKLGIYNLPLATFGKVDLEIIPPREGKEALESGKVVWAKVQTELVKPFVGIQDERLILNLNGFIAIEDEEDYLIFELSGEDIWGTSAEFWGRFDKKEFKRTFLSDRVLEDEKPEPSLAELEERLREYLKLIEGKFNLDTFERFAGGYRAKGEAGSFFIPEEAKELKDFSYPTLLQTPLPVYKKMEEKTFTGFLDEVEETLNCL